MTKHMLSTIDNPYNPFTEYDKWADFDEEQKGYYSAAYLGRVALTSHTLSDEENDEERERAIKEIVDLDPFGLYIRVTEDMVIHPIELPTE